VDTLNGLIEGTAVNKITVNTVASYVDEDTVTAVNVSDALGTGGGTPAFPDAWYEYSIPLNSLPAFSQIINVQIDVNTTFPEEGGGDLPAWTVIGLFNPGIDIRVRPTSGADVVAVPFVYSWTTFTTDLIIKFPVAWAQNNNATDNGFLVNNWDTNKPNTGATTNFRDVVVINIQYRA
jgi:hypothetical protein